GRRCARPDPAAGPQLDGAGDGARAGGAWRWVSSWPTGRARPGRGRRVGRLHGPLDPGAQQVRASYEGDDPMSGNTWTGRRIKRAARLRWVPLTQMRVNRWPSVSEA